MSASASTSLVEVTILTFSGLKNPSWTIAEDQLNEILHKISFQYSSLPQAAPALGYRGFVIINPERDPRFPRQIHIYNGILTVTDCGTYYYKDVCGLEEWLLEQAHELGYKIIVGEARHHLRVLRAA